MAIYYITISALTGLGYMLAKKKNESRSTVFYLAVAFLALTLFASFRYAIGFDYFSYRNIYETASEMTLGGILQSKWREPLYPIVCKLFHLPGCSYPVFLLFVNMFLFFAAAQYFYRFSKLPWVSVYLYITLQFLAFNMNLIRQSIAVAFFLFALPYLKNRKIVPFTILVFAGGLFHNSLFFMYPLYFLLPRPATRRSVGCLTALTVFIYLSFDPLFQLLQSFLPLRYGNYPKSYFWSPNSFVYAVPSTLYCILIFFFRNRIKEPVWRSIYLNSALYNFIISLFITKHFILERFSIYPFTLSLIAIPEIISSYRGEKEHNGKDVLTCRRVLILFLLFGAAYFFFAAAKGFHNVYPYVSLLRKSYSRPN